MKITCLTLVLFLCGAVFGQKKEKITIKVGEQYSSSNTTVRFEGIRTISSTKADCFYDIKDGQLYAFEVQYNTYNDDPSTRYVFMYRTSNVLIKDLNFKEASITEVENGKWMLWLETKKLKKTVTELNCTSALDVPDNNSHLWISFSNEADAKKMLEELKQP